MSKILDEMNSLNRLRKKKDHGITEGQTEGQRPVVMTEKQGFQWRPVFIIMIAVNAVAMAIVISLASRIKELELAAKSVVGVLNNQESKLTGIETAISREEGKKGNPWDAVQTQVRDLSISFKESDKILSELKEDQEALRVSIDDLKLSNRLMLDKYFLLNEKLKAMAGQP